MANSNMVSLDTASKYAKAVGRFQGLISFVSTSPDYYSKTELIEALVKLSGEVDEELDNE